MLILQGVTGDGELIELRHPLNSSAAGRGTRARLMIRGRRGRVKPSVALPIEHRREDVGARTAAGGGRQHTLVTPARGCSTR
jgi:hypothetical protein